MKKILSIALSIMLVLCIFTVSPGLSASASDDQDDVDDALLLIPASIASVGVTGGVGADESAKVAALQTHLRGILDPAGYSDVGIVIEPLPGNEFEVRLTKGDATSSMQLVTVGVFADYDEADVIEAVDLVPGLVTATLFVLGGSDADGPAKASVLKSFLEAISGMSVFGVTINVVHDTGDDFDVTVSKGASSRSKQVSATAFEEPYTAPDQADVDEAVSLLPVTILNLPIAFGYGASPTDRALVVKGFLENISGMSALNVTINVAIDNADTPPNTFVVTVTKGLAVPGNANVSATFFDPDASDRGSVDAALMVIAAVNPIAELPILGGAGASDALKAAAVKAFLDGLGAMPAFGVQITVEEPVVNTFDITVAKGDISASTSITVSSYRDTDPPPPPPPPPPATFTVRIDNNESGGTNNMTRTVTITPTGEAGTNGKYILIQITEAAAGSKPSLEARLLTNTQIVADVVTISYRQSGATISVWVLDTLTASRNLYSSDLPSILAHHRIG